MTDPNDITIGGSHPRSIRSTGIGNTELENANRWIMTYFRAALRDVEVTEEKRAEILLHAIRIYEDGVIDGYRRSTPTRLKRAVASIFHRGLGTTRDTKKAVEVFNKAIDQLNAADVMNMIEEVGDEK